MSSDRKFKGSSFDDFYFPGNRNTICGGEFVSKLKANEMKVPKKKERITLKLDSSQKAGVQECAVLLIQLVV